MIQHRVRTVGKAQIRDFQRGRLIQHNRLPLLLIGIFRFIQNRQQTITGRLHFSQTGRAAHHGGHDFEQAQQSQYQPHPQGAVQRLHIDLLRSDQQASHQGHTHQDLLGKLPNNAPAITAQTSLPQFLAKFVHLLLHRVSSGKHLNIGIGTNGLMHQNTLAIFQLMNQLGRTAGTASTDIRDQTGRHQQASQNQPGPPGQPGLQHRAKYQACHDSGSQRHQNQQKDQIQHSHIGSQTGRQFPIPELGQARLTETTQASKNKATNTYLQIQGQRMTNYSLQIPGSDTPERQATNHGRRAEQIEYDAHGCQESAA
jgi:hypothetical protein